MYSCMLNFCLITQPRFLKCFGLMTFRLLMKTFSKAKIHVYSFKNLGYYDITRKMNCYNVLIMGHFWNIINIRKKSCLQQSKILINRDDLVHLESGLVPVVHYLQHFVYHKSGSCFSELHISHDVSF